MADTFHLTGQLADHGDNVLPNAEVMIVPKPGVTVDSGPGGKIHVDAFKVTTNSDGYLTDDADPDTNGVELVTFPGLQYVVYAQASGLPPRVFDAPAAGTTKDLREIPFDLPAPDRSVVDAFGGALSDMLTRLTGLGEDLEDETDARGQGDVDLGERIDNLNAGDVGALPDTYTPPAASTTQAGVSQRASLSKVATGTDDLAFVTPAGVRQERAALKAELLGGAGPAWDSLQELKALLDSAQAGDASAIDTLTGLIAGKEPALPAAPASPTGKYLRGDRTWQPLATDPGLSAAYGTAAPAAVGVRTRPFDKRANVYGSDAARATLRRALGACLGARANLVNLLIVGDSWESGWKATQIGSTAAVPGDDWGTVLKNLMKEAGYPVTGGWVPAGNGNTPGDARWTFTGTWVRNFTESTFAFSNTAGSTATFTSDDLGTVLEVAAFSTAASVQRSIDGGGAAAWNLTANQVNVQVNPGLGNAPHSVTLTVPVGQQLWVCAARVRQTTGLSISNCAIFGSHTDDWLPTYKNTAGGGGSDISWLNPYKVTRTLVGGTAPTLAIVALGANDAIHAGHTPASMKTNLAAIVNAYKTAGAAVLQRWYNDPTTAGGRALLTPVQAGGVTWETFRSNSYDVSDTYDTVLIDHATVLGDPDTLEAAGLVFSDHLHLLPPGQAAIARADLRALASV